MKFLIALRQRASAPQAPSPTAEASARLPPNEKFTAHRSWEDWLLLILGALIFLSPLLSGSGYQGSPAASAVIVGLVMIFVAELEIVALFWWEEIINLVCGAWIMVAPLVLGYGGQLRLWHFGLGGLVVIITLLELWQDKRGGGTIR